MKRPTREQEKAIVGQWKQAAPELEKFRQEELRCRAYDWTVVDALLELGDRFGRSRFPEGLVEMQRLFMKAARQQDLLPLAVHESRPVYGSRTARTRPPDSARDDGGNGG